MTDPKTAELERAVIEAALAWKFGKGSGEDMHIALDNLEFHLAPKPVPRCEPPEFTPRCTYHWLNRAGQVIPAEWVNELWFFIGQREASSPEDTAERGWRYCGPCKITGTSPAIPIEREMPITADQRIEATDEAIDAWQREFLPSSVAAQLSSFVMRALVRSALARFKAPK